MAEDAATGVDEAAVAAFAEAGRRLVEAIGRVVVGQEEIVQQVLIAVLTGGHVLLEGVPGLGKTLLVRTLSQVLDVPFSRIQFTPDLMPADVTGTNIIGEDESGRHIFTFQPGPIFASVVLADEINRATPKTQSALLEAMQEHTVTVAGETRRLPQPFFVLATQNPLEMEGTYPLPEAQLDRFLLKLLVPFPGPEILAGIIGRTIRPPDALESIISGGELLNLRRTARAVPVASSVTEFAVRLLLSTHPEREEATPEIARFVRAGASPRGLQALITCGQVRALLEGRYNASIEDIRHLAAPVLRHRILLNFEGQAEGITTDALVDHLLSAHRE
jgi:MoxR-like ATPase